MGKIVSFDEAAFERRWRAMELSYPCVAERPDGKLDL